MYYEIPFSIYTHLSDRFCRLSVPATAQLFQEAAELHSNSLGAGFAALLENNRVWVLSKVCYRYVARFPRLDEQVKLRTWSQGADGLIATREFQILSAMNEVLVAATSHWVVMDINTRRVCRCNEEIKKYSTLQEDALTQRPYKVVVPEDMQVVDSFSVPFSSIDKAQHVNNAEYLRWFMNHIPLEEMRPGVKAVDINYVRETQPDEEVQILMKKDGLDYWFQVVNPRGISINCKITLAQ